MVDAQNTWNTAIRAIPRWQILGILIRDSVQGESACWKYCAYMYGRMKMRDVRKDSTNRTALILKIAEFSYLSYACVQERERRMTHWNKLCTGCYDNDHCQLNYISEHNQLCELYILCCMKCTTRSIMYCAVQLLIQYLCTVMYNLYKVTSALCYMNCTRLDVYYTMRV